MRIAGGRLCGRLVRVPKTTARPTQDKVREALFNILGGRISGARFLDLYAGSGAVGLEAWSRGASTVTWVEMDRRALRCLKANVESLCDSRQRIVAGEAIRSIRSGRAGAGYDLVFADPPYDDEGCLAEVLSVVRETGVLGPEGLFIVEEPAERDVRPVPGWRVADARRYGRTGVRFYAKE